MSIFRFLVRLALAIAFAIAIAIPLSPAIAALASPDAMQIAVNVILLFAAMIIAFAPTVRRVFGRGFLLLGCAFLLLPLSAMVLSTSAVNDVVSATAIEDQGLAFVGAGAAGLLMTSIAGFVGFFAGGIFVVLGLVLALGGQREVIVVHQGNNAPSAPKTNRPHGAAKKEPPLKRGP